MSDVLIRQAHVDDAEALAACIDAAYAQFVDRLPDLPHVSEGCAEDIVANQVWVAVAQGEIVGGLVLLRQADAMKLANVAVHPSYRGRGLGRRLVHLAEKEARRQGAAELRLNTHLLMTENLIFYGRLGWAEVSRKGNTVSLRKAIGATDEN